MRAAGAPTGTPSRTGDVALLAAAAAAAVAVHYFAAFLVVAVGIALLLTRRPAWRSWLLAGVPALVVLALLAPLAVNQHSHEANRDWITRFPLIDRIDDAGRSALVGPSPPVLDAVAGGGRRRGREASAWAWRSPRRPSAGPPGAPGRLRRGGRPGVIAAGVGVDAVLGRYLIASLVPLAVGVAMAARWRPGPAGWVGPAAIAVVAGVSLVAVVADARDEDLQRPDWRSVAWRSRSDGDGVEGPRALVVNIYGNLAAPLPAYLRRPGRAAGRDSSRPRPSTSSWPCRPMPCNFLVGRACSLVFLGAPPPEPLAASSASPTDGCSASSPSTATGPRPRWSSSPDDVSANPGDIALVLVDED